MPENKLPALMAEARRASVSPGRGHALARFTVHSGGESAGAQCIRCGMDAYVTTSPPANGIGISGEAVAVECTGWKSDYHRWLKEGCR